MEPELRWRLDVIIYLLAGILVVLFSLAVFTGGLSVLFAVAVLGILLGMLLQALGYTPFPERLTR